ncbi:MAG: serine/threonine-protein kinase [Polyangiaceae bacterium]
MRDTTFYASGLVELHKLRGAEERRAAWRQSMAALAQATADEGPGPLNGLHPEALLLGTRAALQSGLVDDLDWLAPAAAGAALYELASALPLSSEQRDLGRRVLARLLAGNAETFVAIAQRVARTPGKGFANAGVSTRVALVVELPIAFGIADGPLALAIASRRDLARDWIAAASTGSLASRRIAARLLERAACEASRRAAYGSDHALRTFASDFVAPAWRRLLADRESLVWRHVAVARGLLAPWMQSFADEIESGFGETLSPTEWRRSATSIAAQIAVNPDRALSTALWALSHGLADRDAGVTSAFLFGVARAAEAEELAAGELLARVMEVAPPSVGEAVVDLCADVGDCELGKRAASLARGLLAARPEDSGDDGAEALRVEIGRDLQDPPRDDDPVRIQLAGALAAFVEAGAKAAHARAQRVLAAVRDCIGTLEAVSQEEDRAGGVAGAIARRTSLATLRDLDATLLERDVLSRLLSLGGGGDAVRAAEAELDPLRERVGAWILSREQNPLVDDGVDPARLAHPTLSLRRLRALLHLVDGDLRDDDGDSRHGVRGTRWLKVTCVLLDRFERDPPSMIRRTIVAALARALDALVRGGACDVIDALLLVARRVTNPAEIRMLTAAAMAPDLTHVLERYAGFTEALAQDEGDVLAAYDAWVRDLAPDPSGRMEALRTVLIRIGSSLNAIASATSLRDLDIGGQPEPIVQLEGALAALAQLTVGARVRFDPEHAVLPAPIATAKSLSVSVTRVLSGADDMLRDDMIAAALETILTGVPKAIADLVEGCVWRLPELPREGSNRAARTSMRAPEALPPWMPPRRALGGFYVLRALSVGAVGSVFVAVRDDERADPSAEKLALKVPEYSGNAARQLSESEFLEMFREEARALISLPQHPNLARFVTFDAGCKPKPILVMELVEGVTLERLLDVGNLDVWRALRVLDDVLRGLEAMHEAGVGHLDIKPSNVVLRRGVEAVLVDFGLAGRHIRPGCGSGPYGAPEVWGALGPTHELSPAKADMYAFGCLAFEVLTGRVLFDAETEVAQVALHVTHDGAPEPLRALSKIHELAPVAELLFTTLRRRPAERPTATMVRKELIRVAPTLSRAPWPVDSQ